MRKKGAKNSALSEEVEFMRTLAKMRKKVKTSEKHQFITLIDPHDLNRRKEDCKDKKIKLIVFQAYNRNHLITILKHTDLILIGKSRLVMRQHDE